jgi:hypothetical protein
MRFLGLKTRISATLLVILFIGMLLVNLVVVFFWQRSLVQAEIDHTENVVNLLCKKNVFLSSEKTYSPKILMEVCSTIGEPCRNVGLFDGKMEYGIQIESEPSIIHLLRKSYFENKPIKQTTGLTWKMFTFGGKYLYHVLPLEDENGDRYTVAVTLDLERIFEKITEKQSIIFLYIAINAISLGAIGFFRLAKYILRPIDKLIALSESYTNCGGMIFSLSKENNEFGKLSFALNSMLARINEDNQKLKQNIQSLEQANNQLVESQKKIVRAEKMGAVGRLSAGLAHEIGNPIGIVQGYLELLGDVELTPEERQQFSARAVKELERVNKMVRQLLDFSRTSSESENFVSIGKVCRDVVGMIRSQKTFSDLELVVDTYSGNDTVRIGYDELYQVLINCWFNSIDAIEDRGNGFAGRISISSSIRQSSSNPPFMEIQITDNGTGIPKDHLASVFDPFYTTKDVGKGTGLGLSISYSIIEAAGGVMEIESVHGEGTNILISLPKVALQENSALAQRSIANG